MGMHRVLAGVLAASALVSGPLLRSQAPDKEAGGRAKRRVAIFEFENAARLSAPVPYPFPQAQTTTPDIGKAAADLLITQLVQNGSVLVIERDAINKLIAEQNLTNSDRTDARTAAKLGRILGVDAIVLGTVTKYDLDSKTSQTGGRPGFMGFGASSPKIKQNLSAHVEINARVVSPDTAQVLSATQGQGAVDRTEKLDYSQMAALMSGKGEFHDSMLNEAMDKAVSQLADQLERALPEIPVHAVVINGLVADASDSGRLILNVGSSSGVKQGDHLQVWRPGKEIHDPATGRVLTRDDTLLGEAVVVSVEEGFSIASYKGTQAVKVGDVVKGPTKGK
jgi:curli biogenesis system outer membrane secretion channel CsgG